MPFLLENQANRINPISDFDRRVPQGNDTWCILSYGNDRYDPPGQVTRLDDRMRSEVTTRIAFGKLSKGGYMDMGPFEGTILVSQRVKDKLEELEPGLHEFLPIEVVKDKKGEPIGTYYLCVIYERPAIIDHDRTIYHHGGVGLGSGAEFGKSLHFDLFRPQMKNKSIDGVGSCGRIFMDFIPGGPEGRHLWRGSVGAPDLYETGFYKSKTYTDRLAKYLFVSDTFADFMRDEKITGMSPTPIMKGSYDFYCELRAKGMFEKVNHDDWLT